MSESNHVLTITADTDQALQALDELEARASTLPTIALNRGDVRVLNEPHTYRRDVQHSYFRDLTRGTLLEDRSAMERLERHANEMRVNPNRLVGQGGYFAPPLWLESEFAIAPRSDRKFLDLIPHFELPFGVSSVNLPRLTTGTTDALQPDLSSDGADTDIADAQVSSPVVPFAGTSDVSLQLLEQSQPGAAIDWMLFKDMVSSYDQTLSQQVYLGLGSANSQQFYGLLNASGTNSVSYSASVPSATGIYASLGSAAAKIGNNRKMPPENWVMTTSRAAWLGSSEDTQNRPLMLSNATGSGEWDLLSYRVVVDDGIPTNQGAGGNQDVILAVRPSDLVLMETQHRTSVFLEPLSGSIGARIQLHGYAAFLIRYPSAVSVVSGSGMVVQTSSGF